MHKLKRNLYEKALKLLELFPVVAILGPRQCGKTTFSHQLAPDWTYFDLEKPEHWEKIAYDPSYFFKEYPDHLIIDEAQQFPDLFKILRGICDEKPEIKGRFILTGSSSPLLLKNISESLAGRIAVLEMAPLKANEFYQAPLSPFYQLFSYGTQAMTRETFNHLLLDHQPFTNTEIMDFFMYGGYPEPALKDRTFFKFWMENYRDTYINRDIVQLFPKINRVAYRRFLEMLCQLSGTILNKNNIAQSVEISEGTVREYLKIIEGTFLWRSLPSFERNVIKSVIKMPKGYIADSGLQHYLLRIADKESLQMHPMLGHSFECFVIEEIHKGLQASFITNWQGYHYRTRNGAEIDLVLQGEFGVLPVEIKYGASVQLKSLKNLEVFVQEHHCPFGILINNAERIEWIRPSIIQIPVGYL